MTLESPMMVVLPEGIEFAFEMPAAMDHRVSINSTISITQNEVPLNFPLTLTTLTLGPQNLIPIGRQAHPPTDRSSHQPKSVGVNPVGGRFRPRDQLLQRWAELRCYRVKRVNIMPFRRCSIARVLHHSLYVMRLLVQVRTYPPHPASSAKNRMILRV